MSSNQPVTPPTVADVVAALLKMDQSLPVLVSTGFDGSTEHSSLFSVEVNHAYPEGDGNIWISMDENDVNGPDFRKYWPEAIKAVTITA